MSQSTPRVLIVGAGPSGLIIGLTLLKNGIPVRIIEKIPGPRIGQRGSGLMPRTLEVFERLGILDAVRNAAIPVPPIKAYIPANEGTPASTRVFEMMPHKEPTPANPYMSAIVLGQDHLGDIMHEALAVYSCKVESGVELVSFTQKNDEGDEPGYVEATLVKRGAGEHSDDIQEVQKYSWIIGADGAHSVVRKTLGLTFLGETRKVMNLLVGDVFVENLDGSYWHHFGNFKSSFLGLRPTEVPSLFNVVIAGPDVNPRELAEDQEALRKSLIKNVGVEGVEFKDIVCSSHFTMNIRMVDKFGEGRGFVTGDAGHVHSPTGGQGMNSGVQDSFNLGWKLALVVKGIAPRSLLDTYTEERIPVIAEMLNETTKILARAMNNSFGEDTWGSDGTLLQLGVNYRWSSIVVDEQGAEGAEDGTHKTAYGNLDGKLKAGDRAPDVPGLVQHKPASRATIRLFDLFNPAHHTVLLFSTSGGNEHAEVVQSLARYPEGTIQCVIVTRMGSTQSGMEDEGVDFVVEDGAGNASAAYGAAVAQGCSIAIIRPDGVVGAFVTGTQGVHRYFKGVLLERAAFTAT